MKINNNENNNDSTDDVLSLLPGYSEDDFSRNNNEKDINSILSSEMNDTDEDLMALMNMITEQENIDNKDNDLFTNDEKEDIVSIDDNLLALEENEDIFALNENDDIWNLQESSNNKFDEDLLAINELLEDDSLGVERDSLYSQKENRLSSDIGNMFSEVVSAVDSLEDSRQDDIFKLMPNSSQQLVTKPNDGKKKKGILQKIFGKGTPKEGKVESLSDEITLQNDRKDSKENNNKRVKKEDKENTNQNSKKDANKKVKESKEKKANKKVKASKEKKANKKNSVKNNDTDSSMIKNTKKAAKQLKAKNTVTKKKKETKEKKPKLLANIQDNLDVRDDNTYKISRPMTVLTLVLICSIVAFVLIGTNAYSYSLGIKNAKMNFELNRYTEAYNELYGLHIKANDKEIYDKVMTVMYANKQLSSYNNYYAMGEYPKALDSLIKGLEKCKKYKEFAIEIDVIEDLNYVKGQLLNELDSKFNMNEKDAKKLMNSDDQVQYSLNVINASSIDK